MKKLLFILPFLALVACGTKQENSRDIPTSTDSLMVDVMRAVVDTNRSYLEIKEELNRFLDSLEYHVTTIPDEDIRESARYYAVYLQGLLMSEELNTKEELAYFYDSLVMRFADIISTWYIETPEDLGYPLMTQTVVHSNNGDEKFYGVKLDVHVISPEKQALAITLPDFPAKFHSIIFAGDSITAPNTVIFNRADGNVLEEWDGENGETIVFLKEAIDEMLSHNTMFINYEDLDKSKPMEEQLHSCMVLLYKFHEQYKALNN